jgi:hypothetical protein
MLTYMSLKTLGCFDRAVDTLSPASMSWRTAATTRRSAAFFV